MQNGKRNWQTQTSSGNPGKPFPAEPKPGKRFRVAAYCRVSTEQEEQESSFENQVEYYTNLIRINPD